jgi:preprotein translocase subunit SecF
VVDLSINETLNRTVGTSMMLMLAVLPLALFGGATLSGFAWVMAFGVVISTSSSIFISAPIVLYTGRQRLRPAGAGDVASQKTEVATR